MTPRKETAREIAARIRSGIGPLRPMVVRELERRENEMFISTIASLADAKLRLPISKEQQP